MEVQNNQKLLLNGIAMYKQQKNYVLVNYKNAISCKTKTMDKQLRNIYVIVNIAALYFDFNT